MRRGGGGFTYSCAKAMTVDELMWNYNRLAKDISDEVTARKQAVQREKSRSAAAKYRR